MLTALEITVCNFLFRRGSEGFVSDKEGERGFRELDEQYFVERPKIFSSGQERTSLAAGMNIL